MNLSDLLDRPIAFQRSFVRLTKSINAALFLSQAMYWSKRTEDAEGWFYKKQAEWEDETGLTRREQETARKNLREIEVLEEHLQGLPAILYYRVNMEKLRSTLASTASSDATKQPSKIAPKRHTIETETTSENTTDTTEAVEEILKAWNATQFTKCIKLTSKRKAHLKSRLQSQFWKENWREALCRIERDPFYLGNGKTGWVANIEWFIRSDDAVVGIMEKSPSSAQSKLASPADESHWRDKFRDNLRAIQSGDTDWPHHRKYFTKALEAAPSLDSLLSWLRKEGLSEAQIEELRK